MNRKPGRPKKVKEVISNGEEKKGQEGQTGNDGDVLEQMAQAPVQVVEAVQPVTTPKPEIRRPVERAPLTDEQRIKESREALKHPLPPGQRFFETPDGEILIGDADKDAIWSRRMNDGKGGWVNPKR